MCFKFIRSPPEPAGSESSVLILQVFELVNFPFYSWVKDKPQEAICFYCLTRETKNKAYCLLTLSQLWFKGKTTESL